MVRITVYGLPAPQGSKRHVGRGIMIESSKNVKPWREAVKYAALEVRQSMAISTIIGPVCAEMIFTMPKPKSASKGRRTWPDRRPDLSKLVRSTEDALTEILIWEDDARVVSCYARKVFPGEHPDALESPGCVIKLAQAIA